LVTYQVFHADCWSREPAPSPASPSLSVRFQSFGLGGLALCPVLGVRIPRCLVIT